MDWHDKIRAMNPPKPKMNAAFGIEWRGAIPKLRSASTPTPRIAASAPDACVRTGRS